MLLGRFFKDRKAGVAPILALGIIPMVGAIGAAVDYSRANLARTSMQAAVDSTALMLSKNAQSLNAAQLSTQATNDFNALFSRPEAQNTQVTATYDLVQGGFQVTMTASASVKTNFTGLFGYSQIPITASATSTWGMAKLRVALVLDNTGSMSASGKMTALKTASHKLLTQLQSAAKNPGDVMVSIVPFGKDLNAGASNYNASWIDWSDWNSVNGVCSSHSYTTQSSCQSHNKVWTPNNHNTWNGCVTDRTQNYDTLNTTPTTGNTLFPAEQYDSCPTSVVSLSYDWTALNSTIDAMAPAGNTNQAIGLAWGWQSLSQNAPLNAPALDPNYQYQQVIILLSDGLNTQDRWYTSASAIDNRQQIACTNAKTAGITIYTVLVMSGNSNVLKNCASDSTKYFALTDANSIITTFNTIGSNLAKLHLSK